MERWADNDFVELAPDEDHALARPEDAEAGRELRLNRYRRGPVPTPRSPVVYDVSGSGFPDLLHTLDVNRVVSQALRRVLEDAQPEGIQWLPVLVTGPTETRPYWSPHFLQHPEAAFLESQTSRDRNGRVTRWVLDRTRLEGWNVFILEQLTDSMIVTSDVARRVRGAGLTGLTTRRARVL